MLYQARTHVFCFCLILTLLFSLGAQAYFGGNGSAENPWGIRYTSHWNELATKPQDWDKHFILLDDIDLSSAFSSVIGSEDIPFTGTFDGDQYVLSEGGSIDGIFGYVGVGAVIKNLGAKGSAISGDTAGGLVNVLAGGMVQNCYSLNTVSGAMTSGGLVGERKSGTIKNSYAAGIVTGGGSSGGLVGLNTGTDSYWCNDSYWDMEVSGQEGSAGGEGRTTEEMTFPHGLKTYLNWGNDGVRWMTDMDHSQNNGYPYQRYNPGLFSGGSGTAEDPYLIGASWDWIFLSNHSEYWGGRRYFQLVADVDLAKCWVKCIGGGEAFEGYFDGNGHVVHNATMADGEDTYALFGTVSAGGISALGVENIYVEGDNQVAGLVASLKSADAIETPTYVRECYVTGVVRGETNVAGFASSVQNAVVENCFARVNVEAWDNYASAFISRTVSDSMIRNCYAAGEVKGDIASDLAGFLLRNIPVSMPPNLESCYWDMSLAGLTEGFGQPRETSDLVFVPAQDVYEGWDFSLVWAHDPFELNDGYPLLRSFQEEAGTYSGGSGTPTDPFIISRVEDWVHLMLTEEDWSKGYYFQVTADLDFSGMKLLPVGREGKVFNGIFKGQGYEFSHGELLFPGRDHVGLFGYAGHGASITDLYLKNFSVQGNKAVGALAGTAVANIDRCGASGQVQGGEYVGGLVGYFFEYSYVFQCSTRDMIVQGDSHVGGLLGGTEPVRSQTLSECFSTGEVHGLQGVGGLVGSGFSINLSNCYSGCLVEGVEEVGGLVGLVGNPEGFWFQQCYAYGAVSGDSGTGGLVGVDVTENAEEEGCFWDVDASGQESSALGRGFPSSAMVWPYVDGGIEGFDFWSTYNFDVFWFDDESGTTNRGYPRLRMAELESSFAYSGGSGTEEDPFLLSNQMDWFSFAQAWRDWDKHFLLTHDLNFNKSLAPFVSGTFTGTLDGANHAIAAGFMQAYSGGPKGLFSHLLGAVVKNLHVTDFSLRASYVTGGLVGHAENSTLENCSYSGEVYGEFEATGGLIGLAEDCTVIDCFTAAFVGGPVEAGGLIGTLSGESMVSRCYAAKRVTSYDGEAGGFVGTMSGGTIRLGYALGSSFGEIRSGGFVGTLSGGRIETCYASGRVSGNGVTGGFAAHSEGTGVIEGCYWDMDSSEQDSSHGGTGLLSEDMRSPNSRVAFIGWDFDTEWRMDLFDQNNGYPMFRTTGQAYGGGTGTEADPYILKVAGDWLDLAHTPTHWDRHFVLNNDLDMQDFSSFTVPVGTEEQPFRGTLDGGGHRISGVEMNVWSHDQFGVFGVVDGGTIRGLCLYDSFINGHDRVGTLVGQLKNGRIEDCLVSNGLVSGHSCVGGLIGYAEGDSAVENSAFNGSVSSDGSDTGGIAGSLENSKLTRVWSQGEVSNYNARAGGLVGRAVDTTIEDSYASVKLYTYNESGGLVGAGENMILRQCYSLAQFPGYMDNSGGLIGKEEGTTSISACYWNKDIKKVLRRFE